MFLVGISIGFTALGSLIGRDMSYGSARILGFVAIGMLFAQSFVEPLRRGAVGLTWLFGLSLILGLSLGPVIDYYSSADPAAITQAAGGTALITVEHGRVRACDVEGLREVDPAAEHRDARPVRRSASSCSCSAERATRCSASWCSRVRRAAGRRLQLRPSPRHRGRRHLARDRHLRLGREHLPVAAEPSLGRRPSFQEGCGGRPRVRRGTRLVASRAKSQAAQGMPLCRPRRLPPPSATSPTPLPGDHRDSPPCQAIGELPASSGPGVRRGSCARRPPPRSAGGPGRPRRGWRRSSTGIGSSASSRQRRERRASAAPGAARRPLRRGARAALSRWRSTFSVVSAHGPVIGRTPRRSPRRRPRAARRRARPSARGRRGSSAGSYAGVITTSASARSGCSSAKRSSVCAPIDAPASTARSIPRSSSTRCRSAASAG